ncbi:MAG TPA: tRNA (adenosine(37)-N6)-dimethylallyltransferase MiaA [Flavisolibacter sp.]|nr:tRNA (adenosine(37)-N6)-dimethylallyltransferase MiaA [Flavisolibacter sp.]
MQAFQKKKVIVIAGPTAVGKTAVGIAVAHHLGTEIISADSRQCYREMNIGVARPSASELAEVPHHFIATHSIHEKVNAATFEEYALAKAEEIFSRADTLVMVGGTGLYIKAFTDGMDAIPEVPQEVHDAVVNAYQQNGLAWLQERIKTLDPEFYQQGEILNPQRLMRALEVVEATGKSILSFRTGEKKQRPFEVVRLALDLPREELYLRINHRVDNMMEQGLLEEVRSLLSYQHLNALQTVGYKELFNYLNGEASLEEAVDAIKRNTRHYAKRQLTWFRKNAEYHWLPPDAQAVIAHLQ